MMAFSSTPLLPKLPSSAFITPVPESLLLLPSSSSNPREPNDEADDHERYDEERLNRLGEDGSTQQEQADAAKDDWRCDPRLVRAFEIRFPDS